LTAVVTMDLEPAVASVVAAEGTVDAPSEALKALAVAARSYFVAGKGRHRDFDFCDTTHCQFLREPGFGRRLPISAHSRHVHPQLQRAYAHSFRTRHGSRRLPVLFSRVRLLPPAPIALGEPTLGGGCSNPPQLQRVFASAPRPPLRLERR